MAELRKKNQEMLANMENIMTTTATLTESKRVPAASLKTSDKYQQPVVNSGLLTAPNKQ